MNQPVSELSPTQKVEISQRAVDESKDRQERTGRRALQMIGAGVAVFAVMSFAFYLATLLHQYHASQNAAKQRAQTIALVQKVNTQATQIKTLTGQIHSILLFAQQAGSPAAVARQKQLIACLNYRIDIDTGHNVPVPAGGCTATTSASTSSDTTAD